VSALDGDPRFEEALEACCRRVQAGEPLDSCLVDYPGAYREELRQLVPVTMRVTQATRDPSSAFEAALERRLLASVDEARAEARRPQGGGWLNRVGNALTSGVLARALVTACVVALVLGLGGVGLVSAASDSLPDSPLYQVKSAREWLQLALARNPDARLGVNQQQIVQRGRELQVAVERRAPPRLVQRLATQLDASVQQMVDQALTLEARGQPIPPRRALLVLRTMEQLLDRLAAEATPADREILQQLRTTLHQQEQRLTERGVSSSLGQGPGVGETRGPLPRASDPRTLRQQP
jgi:hypothetical protein